MYERVTHTQRAHTTQSVHSALNNATLTAAVPLCVSAATGMYENVFTILVVGMSIDYSVCTLRAFLQPPQPVSLLSTIPNPPTPFPPPSPGAPRAFLQSRCRYPI